MSPSPPWSHADTAVRRSIVRPNNAAALFVLMAVIGATGLTLLPAVLELAVELTRNADGSSAILWASYVHTPAAPLRRVSRLSLIQHKPVRAYFRSLCV